LSDVEVRELRALFGETVEVGGGVALGAEDADVAVALVVGEDDYDIRRAGGGCREQGGGAKGNECEE
jgi:hypothetical protein